MIQGLFPGVVMADTFDDIWQEEGLIGMCPVATLPLPIKAIAKNVPELREIASRIEEELNVCLEGIEEIRSRMADHQQQIHLEKEKTRAILSKLHFE